MQIVLLSGGSGKRLWPLSNEVRSKQFLRLFPEGGGRYISMAQRVYRQIRQTLPAAEITIATAQAQVSVLKNQLGDDFDLCVEPCRRDTFPAIALAASYLRDVKGAGMDEVTAVCPVDPYVEDRYFMAVKQAAELVSTGTAPLMLMGIAPTYPSEKYGYIIPEETGEVSRVVAFREKPDAEAAEKYIAEGALWNSGVFACRIGYILGKARKLLGTASYRDMKENYHRFESISFDYAVAEREQHIGVLRYQGEWKDLGTWNTLTEVMEEMNIGETVLDKGCRNVHAINEMDVPLLCMDLKNMVIAASPNGILVSDKHASSYIKPYVEEISPRTMLAEKSWGEFRIIDAGKESLVIKVMLNPGHEMNYHSHEHRDETWTIIEGEGEAVVDGEKRLVHSGDRIEIPRGAKHLLRAVTVLQAIEIQLGKDISVTDKIIYR